MIPVVSIVGKSNTGKTTFIEKMIPEFVRRGYRVATIKHGAHGFDIDHEGKDTWRYRQAGAHTTLISSPQKVALIESVDKDHDIEELIEKYIRNVDIIIVEGYKGNPYPKIEIFRKERNDELLSARDNNLMAVISDSSVDIDVPCFTMKKVKDVVDMIEKGFLKSE
jgi:molybdopterin-guanine dinucleotide biosynthesis protein B